MTKPAALTVSHPAALRRDAAARHVGVSPTTFDGFVESGIMPPPRAYPGSTIKVWLARELDFALENLPIDGAEQSAGSGKGWEGCAA